MAANPEFASRPRPAWRQKAARFWRWWSDELLALVPERFGALTGTSRLPLLEVEGAEAVLLASGDRAPLDRQAVGVLLERAGETRARARLALGPGEALVRRVTMPAATEENLGSVLGFEMDRLTPFRSEDVYYDYRVVSRDAQAGTLSVLLAVARREVVDSRLEALRAAGVSVQGVAVSGEGAHPGAPLDVLPSTQRGDRESPREAMLRNVLLGAVVVLLMVALGLPIFRKRETVLALHPLVRAAQAEAQATDVVIGDLERQVGDYNFLLEKKHTAPPALALIEDVSRLLPDNTWLQQMDLKSTGKARELQLSGETTSSSKLIEIFEQSATLRNAMPRGTVTRGSQAGTERFVLVAEVKPRAPPEARAISETPLAPPPAPPPVAMPTAPADAPLPSALAPSPATATVVPVNPTARPPSPARADPPLIFQPRDRPPEPVPPPAKRTPAVPAKPGSAPVPVKPTRN